VPKASASAIAQSMPSPVSIILRAVVEEALDGLVASSPSAPSVSFLPISFSVLTRAGLAAALFVLIVGGAQARPAPSSQSALLGL
jgi:hypothetical protein